MMIQKKKDHTIKMNVKKEFENDTKSIMVRSKNWANNTEN